MIHCSCKLMTKWWDRWLNVGFYKVESVVKSLVWKLGLYRTNECIKKGTVRNYREREKKKFCCSEEKKGNQIKPIFWN